MASPETPTAETFESEAPELLDAIARARKQVEGTAGLVDGTLDRFRERIDRLLRESEVDNWRQVRIFNRDVDALAADLGKAAKEKRLSPRLVAALDGSLRKARKRDFYGARKAWRRLDRIADMGAEVRRLQTEYREGYRAVEARIRQLRAQMERMSKIPKPPASPEDARTFNDLVDAFNAGSHAGAAAWLQATRPEERRSLPIPGNKDQTMLERRTPRIVGLVERLRKLNDPAERRRALVAALLDGRFDAWQSAARLYATHGDAAVRKWRGILEKDIEAMGEEATKLAAVLKRFPDPGKVESGSA